MTEDLVDLLFRLAEEDQDECVKQISHLLSEHPDQGMESLLHFIRGYAYQQKSAGLLRQNDGRPDNALLDSIESSLEDFKVCPGLLEKTDESFSNALDILSSVLDRARPGKVQEVFGKTKLKYFMSSGRLKILTQGTEAVGNILSESQRERFLNLNINYPKIVRSAAIIDKNRDPNAEDYIVLALYEADSIFNSSGSQNEIAGFVTSFESGALKDGFGP